MEDISVIIIGWYGWYWLLQIESYKELQGGNPHAGNTLKQPRLSRK